MATVQGRLQDSRILAECSWQGLLQVSTMHEEQARLFFTAGIPSLAHGLSVA